MSERYTYEAIHHLDGDIEYRITDTVGDDRVATCFLEENAKAVTEALNALAREQSELEETANKLADVWLHLDSWARGEVTSLDFVREASASILRHQKAPGWKTPVKGG